MAYEQKYKIELTEITMNFCIKPTTILKYMQETFARYCAKNNLAGYDVYEMGLKWVFGKIVLEYLDVIPLWNEEITVKIEIAQAQALRMFVNFEVETERGLVARAQSTAYVLDLETSRPVPIKKMLDMFGVKKEDLNKEILKYDFKNDGEIIGNFSHEVGIADLDYNDHTNNISYVSYGLSSMPKEFVTTRFPKVLEIKYLKETFLGDTLNCEIKRQDNHFEHIITDKKDNSLVCIVNSIWDNREYSKEYFSDLIKKEKLTFFR